MVVKTLVPFWGTLNIRCRIILGIQKGTIILTTTHLEGHGDLEKVLITPLSHRITPIIPLLTYLLSPHDPPSRGWGLGFGVWGLGFWAYRGLGFGDLGFRMIRQKAVIWRCRET